MKDKYARYVELANEGAKEIGFADVGALWRAGYDMTPADFEADVERLWARGEAALRRAPLLRARQAPGEVRQGQGPRPRAHPRAAPRQHVGAGVEQHRRPRRAVPGRAVARRRQGARDAEAGTREDGASRASASSPRSASIRCRETFWERSLFTRPRDRDVVCHASAWDVDAGATISASRCASSRPRRTSSRSTTSSGTTSTSSATTSSRSSSSRAPTTASTRPSATRSRSA